MIDVIRWARPRKPTLEDLKKILAGEGLASELYSDVPGTKYGRHKHDFDDFVVIVAGKMQLEIEGHKWLMKPGDRLNIPANTPHWAQVVGREEVKYLSAAK